MKGTQREPPMPTPPLPAFLLLLILTTPATAQHALPRLIGPRPSQVLAAVPRGPLQQTFHPDSARRRIPPTRWKEGAFIGGVTAGLGLALWIDAWCRGSETAGDCGGAPTGGFLLGAVTGALIGGQFPKPDDP
jgi:hypothetical protein